VTPFDPERVEMVDLLSDATVLADRPSPSENRQPPAKVDGGRPLRDRVADAKAALYGDREAGRARAREVRKAMVRTGRE
jgi:hypothetical protein